VWFIDYFVLFIGSFRIIFFTKSSDDSICNEEKLKDSRRQLLPLAQILDLPEDRVGERVVGEALLDLRDVTDGYEDQDIGEIIIEDSCVESGSCSEDY